MATVLLKDEVLQCSFIAAIDLLALKGSSTKKISIA